MTTPRRTVRARLTPVCEALEDRRLPAPLAPAPAIVVSGLGGASPPMVAATSLFIEPQAGRGPILQAIASARTEIRLGTCNISDPQIGTALADAVARGVDVQVIVDQADYAAKPAERDEVTSLIQHQVQVHVSNPVFPQSFEKELVIDQREVLIMTMCLVTPTFQDTRDYGVVVTNRGVVNEVTSVFDTDWAFSAPPGRPAPPYDPTPALHVPGLIWGPTDATAKLSALIQSARRTLDVTTELVSDPYLEGQLIAAVDRGVRVRLIAPLMTREGGTNAPELALLAANGVAVHVTNGLYPPENTPPYMHAKSMVVDGRLAYVGSIDLDTVQASQDRELGVILRQRSLVARLEAQFQNDWNGSVAPPARAAGMGQASA